MRTLVREDLSVSPARVVRPVRSFSGGTYNVVLVRTVAAGRSRTAQRSMRESAIANGDASYSTTLCRE